MRSRPKAAAACAGALYRQRGVASTQPLRAPPPSPHPSQHRWWTGQHCRDNGTTIMLGIMSSICIIPSSFVCISSSRPRATNLSATMASVKSFLALFALVAVLHGAAAEVRVDIRETGWSQGGMECCERPILPTIFFVFPSNYCTAVQVPQARRKGPRRVWRPVSPDGCALNAHAFCPTIFVLASIPSSSRLGVRLGSAR